MRILYGLVTALLLLVGTAHAQAAPHPCGTVQAENAEDQLDWLSSFFMDEGNAPARAALHMQDVSEDAPQAVVHDGRVCGRLYAQVVQILRKDGDAASLRQNGFNYVVLRYGPYYAVVMDEPSPGTEFTDMYIFRVSDLAYVGASAV